MTISGVTPTGADLDELVSTVAALLRARGERLTSARRAVLRVLAEESTHLTADLVHAKLRLRQLSAHRASVYRNLDALCELGVVQRVPAAGGCAYHLIRRGHPHPHLQCRRCGQVQDLPPDALDGVADGLVARIGFRLDTGQTALPGLCAGCAAELIAGQEAIHERGSRPRWVPMAPGRS